MPSFRLPFLITWTALFLTACGGSKPAATKLPGGAEGESAATAGDKRAEVMRLFMEADVRLIIAGFILFYVIAASSMSILWTRFFSPVMPLLVFADCLGIVNLYEWRYSIRSS